MRDTVVAKVDDIYWTFILGTPYSSKKDGYYAAADTINFSGWFYMIFIYFAVGFVELTTHHKDRPWLAGCIINGKTYGKYDLCWQGIREQHPIFYTDSILPILIVFNSSTVISY